MEKKKVYAKAIMEKWNMNDLDFVDLVANHLPRMLYDDYSKGPRNNAIDCKGRDGCQGYFVAYWASTNNRVNFDRFNWAEFRNRLDDVFFYAHEIEQFEKIHPELSKAKGTKKTIEEGKQPRPDQRHRLACRKVAKELWKKDRSITISAMAERDEINRLFDGKVYQPATIRTWIKDLCPDRSPGRRKKP